MVRSRASAKTQQARFLKFIYNDKKVSILTDVGFPCENVINNVKDSDILFLESNYDENMLFNGFYPHHLKERIDGDIEIYW